MRTERLQSLADNVFAVALTLLVLQLPLPHGSHHLAHDLARQWPSYAAYVVSFVTVAIVWINHHALMERIRKIDRSVLEFNLLLLLFVAVIPWPTGLLALYLRNRGQSAVAAVVYGVVMALMAISFAGIYWRLVRGNDLYHPEFKTQIETGVRRALVGPSVYLAGAGIALISAAAAFVLYAFVAIFYGLSERRTQLPGLSASETRAKSSYSAGPGG